MVVISINNLPAIGEAIKKRRKALNMLQGELCVKAGITQTYLSQIESGKKMPTIPMLLQILGAIDMELQVSESKTAAQENRELGIEIHKYLLSGKNEGISDKAVEIAEKLKNMPPASVVTANKMIPVQELMMEVMPKKRLSRCEGVFVQSKSE